MNINGFGKRNASDPLLPLRSPKQARKTFIRADGERASPSESETLGSRWKAVAKSVVDLTRETANYLVFSTWPLQGCSRILTARFRKSDADTLTLDGLATFSPG